LDDRDVDEVGGHARGVRASRAVVAVPAADVHLLHLPAALHRDEPGGADAVLASGIRDAACQEAAEQELPLQALDLANELVALAEVGCGRLLNPGVSGLPERVVHDPE